MDNQELMAIALKDMDEYRAVLKEKLAVKTFDLAEKIIAKSKTRDKRDLLSVTTFDLFLLGVNIVNDNEFSYEDTLMYANYSRSEIDSWTYENSYSILVNLSKNLTSEGYLENEEALKYFRKLKLHAAFINYSMAPVYVLVSLLLKFKYQVKVFESKYSSLSSTAKTKYINDLYTSSGLANMFELIVKYIDDEKEKHKLRQEIAREKVKNTKEVMKFIESGEIQKLCNMKPEWHHYLNPGLLEALYEIINTNQIAEYGRLEREKKDLEAEKNKSRVIAFLYDNKINPRDVKDEIIIKLEEVDKRVDICFVIKFLMKIGFSCYDIVCNHIDLLDNLDEDKIEYIEFLISGGVISKDTIRDNLELLNDKFSNLKLCYEFLKTYVDFNNMFYNDSILLVPLKELKARLEVLSLYDLNKNNFMFLFINYEYLNIYDLLIENDISTLLFIQICKTSNPLNTIKRILVYKMIGEEYQTVTHELRKEVASDGKSLIEDEDLDMFIGNVVPDLILSPLDEKFVKGKVDSSYFDSEFLYEKDKYLIGSSIISRPKFIRNYSKSSNILVSLLSNSIVSEDEYYEMLGVLKQIKK